MGYNPQVWTDGVTPLSAARLNVMETGIEDADVRVSAVEALGINAQTGTVYTLALADQNRLVTLTNAAAVTVTVPPNSSAPFPVGTTVTLAQLGAGQVTVAAGVGVTVSGAPGLKLTDLNSAATLIKLAINSWLVSGRLSA